MGKSKIKSNQRNLKRTDDQIYTVQQQLQHSQQRKEQQQLIQRNVFVVYNFVVYFFIFSLISFDLNLKN